MFAPSHSDGSKHVHLEIENCHVYSVEGRLFCVSMCVSGLRGGCWLWLLWTFAEAILGISVEMPVADLSIILVSSTIQLCMSLRLDFGTHQLNPPGKPTATQRNSETSGLRQPAARALLVRAGGVSFVYFCLRFARRLDTTCRSWTLYVAILGTRERKVLVGGKKD